MFGTRKYAFLPKINLYTVSIFLIDFGSMRRKLLHFVRFMFEQNVYTIKSLSLY